MENRQVPRSSNKRLMMSRQLESRVEILSRDILPLKRPCAGQISAISASSSSSSLASMSSIFSASGVSTGSTSSPSQSDELKSSLVSPPERGQKNAKQPVLRI